MHRSAYLCFYARNRISSEMKSSSLDPIRQFMSHNRRTRLFATSSFADDIYRNYLETKTAFQELRVQTETKKSAEMYEAWKRAEERSQNPKTTGVAVVRTLVKETRKEDNTLDELQKNAHNLLEQAALQYNHPRALVELGNIALEKEGDPARAMDYYERSDSAEGWYNIGSILWSGRFNDKGEVLVKESREEALTAFRRAVDLGDADAMYFVGVETMDDKPKNGLDLIDKAAAMGHSGALYYLAVLHLNGDKRLSIAPCEPDVFLSLLQKAIDEGSGDALFLRGHAFIQGDYGLPVDYSKALEDFLLASDLGHADAAVSAGAILHRGYPGVKQNQEQAFSLYQVAGELGSTDGWRNVVACYATGEGVTQSKETATYIAKTMLREEDAEDNRHISH